MPLLARREEVALKMAVAVAGRAHGMAELDAATANMSPRGVHEGGVVVCRGTLVIWTRSVCASGCNTVLVHFCDPRPAGKKFPPVDKTWGVAFPPFFPRHSWRRHLAVFLGLLFCFLNVSKSLSTSSLAGYQLRSFFILFYLDSIRFPRPFSPLARGSGLVDFHRSASWAVLQPSE